jgi:hypothetical protein
MGDNIKKQMEELKDGLRVLYQDKIDMLEQQLATGGGGGAGEENVQQLLGCFQKSLGIVPAVAPVGAFGRRRRPVHRRRSNNYGW